MSVWRPFLPAFPRAQGPRFWAPPWARPGVLKASSCSGASFCPCRGEVLSWLSVSDSLATLWAVAHQVPLLPGVSRQDYWSGLPFSSPGDLPHPGTKPASPALAGGPSITEPAGKPRWGKWQMPVCRWQNPEDCERKSQQRRLKKSDRRRGREPVHCGVRETESGVSRRGRDPTCCSEVKLNKNDSDTGFESHTWSWREYSRRSGIRSEEGDSGYYTQLLNQKGLYQE